VWNPTLWVNRSITAIVQFLLTTLLLRQAILGRPGTFMSFSFVCRATFARRVVFGLKMSLLRHATIARQDIFLQAKANFIRDPQSPRVSSFVSPRRPAACFLPLYRLFSPLTGFTTASSLRTCCWATPGFVSTEVCFLSSCQAFSISHHFFMSDVGLFLHG
jgi:hypothetical protein